MRFTKTAGAGLLVLFVLWCGNLHAGSEEHPGAAVQAGKSRSPNGLLAVFIIANPANAGRRLALMPLETEAVLADVALPKTGIAFGQSSTRTNLVWKQDSKGVVVSFSDKTNSIIFACVKVSGDRFKWLDMKVAEGPNLGVLGRPRTDFVRVEDTPTRWVDETANTPRMVYVKTRFWDRGGQRYTVEQEFSISPSGEIGWK
jgi:hypothetical protein